jgi:hypothetical protein
MVRDVRRQTAQSDGSFRPGIDAEYRFAVVSAK